MAVTAKKNTATKPQETQEKVETKATETPLDSRVARLAETHEIVKNHTMAAVGVGFIPVPFVDMGTLTAIQLKMLYSLAKCYQVPFSKNLVKSLVSSLLGSSLAISIALPVGSLLKAVPIIGQTSGMISTACVGAASTYAVGKVFVAHFESGGTFLDFDVEKAKVHFKELYEEGKSFVSTKKTTEVEAEVKA
ncbi:MAG: DUF697 domain-containing protein [Methylococcales bacterium]|nr:DUF697 domain-containing protein [Methylococcales bacterium]